MQHLQRGQKLLWSTLAATSALEVELVATAPELTLDFSCFGLDAASRLTDERYFIFYNQTTSPCGALRMQGGAAAGSQHFALDLAQLPAHLHRLVFVITIDGPGAMRALPRGHWRLHLAGGATVADFTFSGADFAEEKALMVGEFYRREGEWRLTAIGQGFNGGLGALLRHFGGEETTASAPPVASPAGSTLEQRLGQTAPHLLALAGPLRMALVKRQLEGLMARVALVLDCSGSMNPRFKSGEVQAVLDRVFPLAAHFDDDGQFDFWAFAEEPLALTPVAGANLPRYIEEEAGGWKLWRLGARQNNELKAVRAVIEAFRHSRVPAFVIFISDGGVKGSRELERLITEASTLPIFWQFVGLGGKDYGILERLDTLQGRLVDNCNFFALDDLASLTEPQLYDRLLTEFPLWLRAARERHIL